jgi:hypothetical protein
MFGAAVPEASIDKDEDAMTDEGDIRYRPPCVWQSGVDPVAQTAAVQGAA